MNIMSNLIVYIYGSVGYEFALPMFSNNILCLQSVSHSCSNESLLLPSQSQQTANTTQLHLPRAEQSNTFHIVDTFVVNGAFIAIVPLTHRTFPTEYANVPPGKTPEPTILAEIYRMGSSTTADKRILSTAGVQRGSKCRHILLVCSH